MNQMMMNSMSNMPMNSMCSAIAANFQNQAEQQPQQLTQMSNSYRIENSINSQNAVIYAASPAAETLNQIQQGSASACAALECGHLTLSSELSELSEKFEVRKHELISKRQSSNSSSSQESEQGSSLNEYGEQSSYQEDLNEGSYCYSCSSSYRYYNNNNNPNNCKLNSICNCNYNQKTAFLNSNSSCFCRGSFSGGFRGFRPSCCCCRGGCRKRGGYGLNNSYSLSTSSSNSSTNSAFSSQNNDDHFFDFNNNITKEEAIQPLLQGSIRQILSNGPRVGLYESENEEEWNLFVKKLLAYFGERAGSRAKANEEIKIMMEQHKSELTDLLLDLGLQYGKCSIKEIIAKTDSYVPCAAKRELEGAESNYRKQQQNLNELRIEGSKVRLSILQGLQKSGKYTDSSVLEERISKIIEGRIQELKNLENKVENLRKRMQSDAKYLRLLRLKTLLKECFEMWEEADKNAGKETQNNGKKLEELMMSEGNKYIEIIIKRIGEGRTTSNVNIHHNLLWEGVDGEVDIAITDVEDEKVLALVEVKSRLYDIAAAFRQSGPLRQKNKKRLIIKSKLVEVPLDVPVFVVTTTPQHSFSLEFESKLKDSLNKYFSNTEPHLIDYAEVYKNLKPVYNNLISPLQWFDLYASKYLIIIDQEASNTQQLKQQQSQLPIQHHHHHSLDHKELAKLQYDNAKILEHDCCINHLDDHNMSLETDDDHNDLRDQSLKLRDQVLLSLESRRLSSHILSSQPSSDQMSDEDEDDFNNYDDENQEGITTTKQFNSTTLSKLGDIKMFSLVSINEENRWQRYPQPWPQPQPQPQPQEPQQCREVQLESEDLQNQQQQQQQQQLRQQQQQLKQDELVQSQQSQICLSEQKLATLSGERSRICSKYMNKLKKSKEERKKVEASEEEETREQKEECREPVKKIQKMGFSGKALRQIIKGQQSQARVKFSPTRQPYDDQKIKNPQTQQQC